MHHTDMGKRGHGYLSEDHLLRYRGEQPAKFDRMVLDALDAADGTLQWIYPANTAGEREPEGLEFLRDLPEVIRRGLHFGLTAAGSSVGMGSQKLSTGDAVEWILIEAKANAVEFVTPACGASVHGGLKQIEAALGEVKHHLGVHRDYPWLGTYYQHANRLAVLHFLNNRVHIRTRLLNIYFIGDCFPDGRHCPTSEADWRPLLSARDITLGLPTRHPLSDRCVSCFISAIGRV